MSVIVVGGGISGLATAYYLHRRGVAATLIEASDRLGGLLWSEHVDDCLLERGPDSFLAAKTAAADLMRDLGIDADRIGSNDGHRRTFIWRDGQLLAMPEGLAMMAPTDMAKLAASALISPRGRLRAAQELLRGKPATPLAERSIGDFVRDHWGDEFVEYLAEPLLTGVFGGDVNKLSASEVLPRFVDLETRYGSVSRGLMAEPANPTGESLFQALKGGWQQLVDSLDGALAATPRVHDRVQSIVPGTGARWRAEMEAGSREADHVVIALRTWQAAPILRSLAPNAAALLDSIDYSSAVTVGMTFFEEQMSGLPEGFGFLVPKIERDAVLACTFVDRKFAHRAGKGRVVLRAFLGGDRWCEASDDEITAAVRADMARILKRSIEPRHTLITRWPRSMPQYEVGHRSKVTAIRAAVASHPGIWLTGNAYEGIGIPDCIRLARATATAIAG